MRGAQNFDISVDQLFLAIGQKQVRIDLLEDALEQAQNDIANLVAKVADLQGAKPGEAGCLTKENMDGDCSQEPCAPLDP